MKYNIRGKGTVNLDPMDYQRGGEAKVFIQNDIAYKIYHDPKNMIPEAKIMELNSITTPNIFKPMDIILDKKDKQVGFTMLLAKGVPLVKLYTNNFRKDHNISPDDIVGLVTDMQNAVADVHGQNFVVVDMNDLNIIVELKQMYPQFIDVNSWKTPSFPPTAINPNVKDYHAKDFSDATDWFSFAIITCYLFLGVHPFRGTHPKYKRSETRKRMLDNVSIFNPDIRLAQSVRGFDVIPKHYKEWYILTFEKGKRIDPPDAPGTAVIAAVKVQVFKGSDNFEITLIKEYPDDVIFSKTIFGRQIVKTTKHINIEGSGSDKLFRVNPGVDMLLSPKNEIPIMVKIGNGYLLLKSTNDMVKIDLPNILCEHFMIVNNALYGVYDGIVTKFDLTEMNNTIFISTNATMNIMKISKELFSTMIYQSILDKSYIVIPTGTIFYNIEMPELNEYKIIDAKHDDGVVMIVGLKNNIYDRLIIRFDEHHDKYHVRVIEDVDYTSINFITLANGLVISINEDDSLEIFFKDPSKKDVKRIEDPNVNSNMHLHKNGMEVRVSRDQIMYLLKMK